MIPGATGCSKNRRLLGQLSKLKSAKKGEVFRVLSTFWMVGFEKPRELAAESASRLGIQTGRIFRCMSERTGRCFGPWRH
jgi:hypothetical protein